MSQKTKMKLFLQSLMGNTLGFSIGRMQANRLTCCSWFVSVYKLLLRTVACDVLSQMKPGESVSFLFILLMGGKSRSKHTTLLSLGNGIERRLTILLCFCSIRILYMFMDCIQNWWKNWDNHVNLSYQSHPLFLYSSSTADGIVCFLSLSEHFL